MFCQKCGANNEEGDKFCGSCGSILSIDTMNPPNTHQPISDQQLFGGFWIRVGAYFVDVVVLLIPMLLISFLFRAVTPASDELEQAIVQFMDFLLSLIVWWIYFAVLHSSTWQASVGKKLVGLKAVDKNMHRISFGRATGRYFAEIISALILCIGYMMVGWTKKKQGLHDMTAGTYVIKA